jgi:hypothetical protein
VLAAADRVSRPPCEAEVQAFILAAASLAGGILKQSRRLAFPCRRCHAREAAR